MELREDSVLVRDEVDDAVRDDDVEAPVGEREALRLALEELDVPGAQLGGSAARLREHLRRHVDPGDPAFGAHHLRSHERVRARAAAEVEDPLARLETTQLPRVRDPGEGLGGRVGTPRELRG